MANEKKIKSKIIHKHDTVTNWTTAGNNGYVPDKGEFIIYDADSSVNYERIKVGDGATNINDLPFANDFAEKATQDGDGNVITDTYATKDSLDSKLDKLKFTGGIQFYTEQANGTTLMNGEYGARSGVALRNGTGQLQVGEPTAVNHATTKKYVDDKFVNGEFTTSVGVPEIKLDKNGLYYEHDIDGNTYRADLLRTEDGGINLTTNVQTLSMLPSGTSFKAGTIYATEGMYYFPSGSDPQPFATQDFVTDKIAEFVDSAPETLNTLNELAAALGDDPNFATTVATEIGKKVDKTTTINGKALSSNITLTQEDIGVSLESLGVTATANELNYTEGVTSNIQDQLDKKVESTTTFIDNEVAYTKKLPQYTSAYAQLNYIGGTPRECANLLQLEEKTEQSQGVTFTVENGTITANGTATSTAAFSCQTPELIAGKTYTISSGVTTSSSSTYQMFISSSIGAFSNIYNIQNGSSFTPTVTGAATIQIYVYKDTALSNLVFKPMLNEGATAFPFEPYFEGFCSVPVTALEIKGANLIPFPYVHDSQSRNGLDFIVNADGSLTVNGTATASFSFIYSRKLTVALEHGKTYRISSGVIISYKNAEGTTKYAETKITWDDSYTFIQVYYYFAANKTFDITYYPMINEGTVLHPYAKYSKEIISIPQEVLDLPEYGAGNPNDPTEYNSIEWTDETAKYVQRGSIIDGEWVALDAPVITDITSQIFERNIKVECCGYLTFINSNQIPVPNSITIHTDNVDVLAADVFVGDLVGEANKAEYAEKDAEGNVIADTYFKNNHSVSSLHLKNIELNGDGIATISDNGMLERIRFSGGNLELNSQTINASCEAFVVNGRVGLDADGLFLEDQNNRWYLHKIDPNDTNNSYIGGTMGLTVSSETLYAHNVMVDGTMMLYTSDMLEPQLFATQEYVNSAIESYVNDAILNGEW